MKYVFSVFRMSFNKIISGQKRIDIRLSTDEVKAIRPHDIIEYVCNDGDASLHCLVKSVMFFDTISSMEKVISPELIGYSNWQEIKLRIERIYPLKERRKYLMEALYIEPINELENSRDFGAKDMENEDKYLVHSFKHKKSSYQTMQYRDDRRPREEEELEKNAQELLEIAEQEEREKEGEEGYNKEERERYNEEEGLQSNYLDEKEKELTDAMKYNEYISSQREGR